MVLVEHSQIDSQVTTRRFSFGSYICCSITATMMELDFIEHGENALHSFFSLQG
jgi:alpha/beta superfamily hydrolase